MEEVEDEPLFADRVAGLDIGKAGVEVTIRVPPPAAGGRRAAANLSAAWHAGISTLETMLDMPADIEELPLLEEDEVSESSDG
jgi:hypothetical protein